MAVKLGGGSNDGEDGAPEDGSGDGSDDSGGDEDGGGGVLNLIIVGGVALGGLLSPLALAGAPTDSRTQSSVGEQRLVSFFFSSDAWGGRPFFRNGKAKK